MSAAGSILSSRIFRRLLLNHKRCLWHAGRNQGDELIRKMGYPDYVSPSEHIYFELDPLPPQASTAIKDMKSGEFYGYTALALEDTEHNFIINDFKYRLPRYHFWQGPFFYRVAPVNSTAEQNLINIITTSLWVFLLWHFWHDSGAVFGHFKRPDPLEFSDEELGIPPDDYD